MEQPKLTRRQAITIWESLTPSQRLQFNELLEKLEKKQLMYSHINVDDNEVIQSIILEPKEKTKRSMVPFS